jgi:hypothetical protein
LLALFHHKLSTELQKLDIVDIAANQFNANYAINIINSKCQALITRLGDQQKLCDQRTENYISDELAATCTYYRL